MNYEELYDLLREEKSTQDILFLSDEKRQQIRSYKKICKEEIANAITRHDNVCRILRELTEVRFKKIRLIEDW